MLTLEPVSLDFCTCPGAADHWIPSACRLWFLGNLRSQIPYLPLSPEARASFNVYGHDPVEVGVRSIPIGFGIMAGACIVLALLTVFRGHNKELLIISSILMTAGKFSW